jgi:uncharacterized DUF497 family protein
VHTNLDFEWDQEKATTNARKHGIDFADVVGVFDDDLAITILEEDSDEERFISIGMDTLGRLAVVVYSWRGTGIRIVSARKATRHERRQYEGMR